MQRKCSTKAIPEPRKNTGKPLLKRLSVQSIIPLYVPLGADCIFVFTTSIQNMGGSHDAAPAIPPATACAGISNTWFQKFYIYDTV